MASCVTVLVLTVVVQILNAEFEWTFTPKNQEIGMSNLTDVVLQCTIQGVAENLSYGLHSPNSALLNRFRSHWNKEVAWINTTTERVYWIIESDPELNGLEVIVDARQGNLDPIRESSNCNYTLRYRIPAPVTCSCPMPTEAAASVDESRKTDENSETDATDATIASRSSSRTSWTSRVYGNVIAALCLLMWMGT